MHLGTKTNVTKNETNIAQTNVVEKNLKKTADICLRYCWSFFFCVNKNGLRYKAAQTSVNNIFEKKKEVANFTHITVKCLHRFRKGNFSFWPFFLTIINGFIIRNYCLILCPWQCNRLVCFLHAKFNLRRDLV